MGEVNIVWNPNREDVLTRLATTLAHGTGWSIGKNPDPQATINYWMLYINLSKSNWHKTRTAAWFSHWEPGIPQKQQWWGDAATKADIRTTCVEQYYNQLVSYGETHLVIPPIDSQFFIIPSTPPRIGVGGYVHPGGRKGEQLVKRLYAEHGGEWEIIASGKGWPVDHVREYAWAELPDFYRSLDVYLCTSLTEGIPMPPLEALACGVKVVIPRGVGLLDTLENRGRIFRYGAGDYDTMVTAINDALHEREYQRAAIAHYNEDDWCRSHRRALLGEAVEIVMPASAALSDEAAARSPVRVESVPVETSAERPLLAYHTLTTEADNAEEGVVYVAYGNPARDCAVNAIASWKRHMTQPVAFVGDSPLNAGEDIFIEHPDTDIGARSVKTRLYEIVPAGWQRWLYLDSDTEVITDVSFLFQLLRDGWDFLICGNPTRYYNVELHKRPDNTDEFDFTINTIGSADALLPNGGVFGVSRNARTEVLMRSWHDEWQRYGARDQFALLRALQANPVKLHWLTIAWNTVTRYYEPSDSAGILHQPMEARRWKGLIEGRLDSPEAWKAVKR